MADGVRRTVTKGEEKFDPALAAVSVIKNFVPRVPRAQLTEYLRQCSTEKALHNLVVMVEELEDSKDLISPADPGPLDSLTPEGGLSDA